MLLLVLENSCPYRRRLPCRQPPLLRGMLYRMIKKSLCTCRLQYTQLMSWKWPSQNTFGMWTVLYWTRSSRTQFGVSIIVWRLTGDTLNITCNFLYCNHQVHRDFLITLYHKLDSHCDFTNGQRKLFACNSDASIRDRIAPLTWSLMWTLLLRPIDEY